MKGVNQWKRIGIHDIKLWKDMFIMDKSFPLNRFDFSDLIEDIQKIEIIPNVIVDNTTGIEFYVDKAIPKDNLLCFLKEFNLVDNIAQNDSKQEYEKHIQVGIKNFQFEPSWVKVTTNKVTVGYVGIYVNTDFSLTFSKLDNEWILEK